jgi:putative effector of murein hydrolase LrgA (UPF0299 family)
MLSELIVLTIVVSLALWVTAIVDVIRATEMEPIGRLILAALLIFLAPVGVLVWVGMRGGRFGMLAATAVATVAVAVTMVVVAGVSGSSNGGPRTIHTQSFSVEGSVPAMHPPRQSAP